MKTSVKTFFAAVIILLGISGKIFAGTGIADSSATGFTVKHEIKINCPADSLWQSFLRVGDWWDPEHTWSGDSKNLFIQPYAGGVFGEKLANGGSVLHMTVYYIAPGTSVILRGGLGPLMALGVEGSMSFTFLPDGNNSKLMFHYMVGGYCPGGLWRYAPLVDKVLGHQLERLKQFAEGKK